MKKVLLITLGIAVLLCLASCASFLIEDEFYIEPDPYYPYYPEPYDPYSPYRPDPYYPVIGTPYRVESTGMFRDELILNITSGMIRSKGYRDGDRIRVILGNAGEFSMPIYLQRTNNTYHSLGMHISVFDTERVVIRYTGGHIAEMLGIRAGDPVYILF